MKLHENLQALRKEAGFSQERLAEQLGVSRQAVSKWESGQSTPDLDNLTALSDLFGVSLDGLVRDGAGTQQNPPSFEPIKGVQRAFAHYEYKSRRTLFGLPLVHVHFGRGLCKAKGIFAIGNLAIGLFSLGIVSVGLVSIGALALGLLAFAALSFGLVAGIGGFAAGVFSVGGISLGIFSIGGIAVGMFATGGVAVASHVAVGGYAAGHIAIGDAVRGAQTLHIDSGNLLSVSAEQVRALVRQEFPNLWDFAVNWAAMFFR